MVPVLNNGYVKSVAVSLTQVQLREFQRAVYRGVFKESLLSVPIITLEIKAPLFLVLALAQTNLKLFPIVNGSLETYIPSLNEIKSGSHEKDVEIHEHLSHSMQAISVSSAMYKEDGCNAFVASMLSPIASYWTGYITGSLKDYRDFFTSIGAPKHIAEYQRAIKDLVIAEYPDLGNHL